jgi:hypothetical protein
MPLIVHDGAAAQHTVERASATKVPAGAQGVLNSLLSEQSAAVRLMDGAAASDTTRRIVDFIQRFGK